MRERVPASVHGAAWGEALAFASGVVREAAATGEPADRLLRRRLREARPGARTAADAARAVFAWFRWRGFLERFAPDAAGLERALRLADRHARAPGWPPDENLLDRAVPSWLHGAMEVTPAFVRQLQAEPALWLRARPGCAAALAAALPGARAGLMPGLPDAVLYGGAADLFRTEAFRRGDFEIQDSASQAVGVACAPRPGETWWDACAGEGGKTLHLSALMENRGLVWATDRAGPRLARLRRRAARAGAFNYRWALWRGDGEPPVRTRFDGILVDAPCSGVGTWARNPHARWVTTPADVDALAAVQEQLLAAAAGALKPGGRLVYAVCTLTRRETSGVADRFQAGHAGFDPLPLPNPFSPGAAPSARQSWLPERTRGNGMFLAAWRRNSH